MVIYGIPQFVRVDLQGLPQRQGDIVRSALADYRYNTALALLSANEHEHVQNSWHT
jgi:hypothetical protein